MFAASKTSRLVPAGPTSDTYFNYVTSLLHGDGTNGGQNSTFLDSSTNNFTITTNGDTTQGTFSPFNGGNYSNYFDGNGDYLTLPDSSAWVIDSNYTIEFWFYANSFPGQYNNIICQRGGASSYWGVNYDTTLGWAFFWNNGAGETKISRNQNSPLNQWVHVAIVKVGTNGVIFLNGQQAGAIFTFPSISDVSSPLYIGAWYTPGDYVNGFISNLRLTKGAALYTSNFTPSTLPLNTTSQTVLLTCASNRFEDLSGANNTITKNGDTAVQTFSPFVQSSSTPVSYGGFFDGAGDYLSVPYNAAFVPSGDFTIECFVYLKSLSVYARLMTMGVNGGSANWGLTVLTNGTVTFYTAANTTSNTTTNTVSLNTWTHVAVSRQGSTMRIFLNGTIAGTFTNSASLNNSVSTLLAIGADSAGTDGLVNGCISNARIVSGTGLYTTNFTPPTAPLTAVSGTSLLTCQSSTFIDNSSNAFAITVNGNSQPIKGNPFGYTIAATTGYSVASNSGSGYFDGSGDYLSIAQNAAFNFASGNFTIEAWVYVTSSANSDQSIIASNQSWGAGAVVLKCYHGGNISFSAYDYNSSGTAMLSTPAILNTWNHVALVRNGNVFTLYVNGVSASSVTSTISVSFAPTGGTYVGYDGPINSTTGYAIGYISNLRVLKGTALYTSAFAPSISPLTSITNTQLLMLMSNASIIDNAEQNDLRTVGAAQISTSVKKYGTGSVSLNGTNSYLLTYYQPSQLMGSGNFTIEGWIYPTASTGSAYRPIVVSSIFNTFSNSDLQYMLYLQTSGYITFQAYVGTIAYTVQSSTTVSLNTWTYVTVVRNGATITLYVNGTSVSTSNISTNTLNSSVAYTLRYGGYVNVNTFYYFSGNLDEFRITKGIARYIGNFTPPTYALPNY